MKTSRKKSDELFHILPENLNCAQSVLKGFQKEFSISEKEIDEYRAWGGGRAVDGMCGALFAAERLLRQVGKESVVDEFRKKAGGLLCSEIKEKHFTCAEYVRMADELVEKSI
jgi:Putative redox-active protein (C_GCAxxG_C_C)